MDKIEQMEQTVQRNFPLLQMERFPVQDQRYLRGQVWWLKGVEAKKTKIVNGVEVFDENGTRPVIIISNNIVNRSKCDYVTVVPCTSNLERADICTNITYTNYKGIRNCCQTNHVMSVEKSKLMHYHSTLDNEVVEKIEQALKIQMGLAECEGDYFGRGKRIVTKNVETEDINSMIIDDLQPESEEIPEKLEIVESEPENSEQMEVYSTSDVWDLAKWKTEVAKGRIKWNLNREIEFMRFYEELGASGFARETGMKMVTATNRASLLKKKYKDFLSLEK